MKNNEKNKNKGFVRNTAINVAQDIVSAGNPFNPGGHLVGSIVDGVLMEAGDRRMVRKMYNNINDKTASEILNDLYFEKTAAGIGTVFSMIGKNVGKLGTNVAKYGDKIATKSPMVGNRMGSLGKGVSRYGELLAGGKDVSQLTNNMNAAKKTFFDSGKRLSAFDKKTKAGAFSGKSQDAVQNMRNNMYNDMMNKKDTYQAAKNALELEPSKVLAARVGTGVGVGALGMNTINNISTRMAENNKTASEILDDLYFEKTAGVGSAFSAIGKGAKRYKSLLTGSRIGNLTEDANDAKRIYDATKKIGDKNAYNALNNQLNSEKNKVLATRVGTGVAGGIGLGASINHFRNRDDKTASETLDDLYFEKTAGIGSAVKKIGTKISSSKPVRAVMSNPTISRGAELMTGSRAKALAKEIQDIENQKDNLTILQRLTGKKARLNRAQNKKYKDFDIEAREVERARRGVVGAGAVGLTGANLLKNHIKDKRYLNSMPEDDTAF